jgi:hypothetical protein
MLKRIAVLAVMSALSMGFAVTALAGSSVVLRVVAVKTDNVAAYVQEIDRAKAIVKRLGRPWRRGGGSFAGSAPVRSSSARSLRALLPLPTR